MPISKALRTKTLPQYRESEDVMARFLVAAQDVPSAEITPTPYMPGVRSVLESELEGDTLQYFLDHDQKLKEEFFQDLKDIIDGARAQRFCDVIADAWYDGNKRRKGPELLPIRASIETYLHKICGRAPTEDTAQALLTAEEVAKVLSLSWRLLETSVDDWLEMTGPDRDRTSSDVFFRRGLSLPELFKDDHEYAEPSVISSYTLSVTLAEQFANTIEQGMKSAIIHADFHLMHGRVLFFSPFVPGMKSFQLEAGVIPGEKPQRLSYTGIHRGVGEYLLDYPEELLNPR